MTTDNTQEIDEILTRLENAVERDVVHRQLGSSQPRGRSPKVIHAEAKRAILDWHNKQVGAVLDRLESMAAYDPSGSSPVINPRQIEAERDKLKESK